jgi:hypothetical protein
VALFPPASFVTDGHVTARLQSGVSAMPNTSVARLQRSPF